MPAVENIINNAIMVAQNKSNLADAYTGIAIQQARGGYVASPPEIGISSVDEPNVYIPTRVSGIDTALFNSMYRQIIEDLSDRYLDFMTTFFPIRPSLMPAVELWLENAITQGGTGIRASVEEQIWQRDRDRISTEASSASEEAVSMWAARGYPLPPGAANATLQAIARKRSADMAAVSREAAIKAFETEIENVRFAITQAIDYRTKALSAAGDFIKALAVAPNIASSMSSQSADAQARLISAVGSYYNSRINAGELEAKILMFNADNSLKAVLANQDTEAKFAGLRVQAAVSAAESIGQQAAAALNGLNATAQLSESVD